MGKSTGSGLPGESAGILRPVSDWSGTTAPTVAFGQGYSLTAMQATSIFATIANDGVRVEPRIIESTIAPDGTVTPTPAPKSVQVVKATTAKRSGFRSTTSSVLRPMLPVEPSMVRYCMPSALLQQAGHDQCSQRQSRSQGIDAVENAAMSRQQSSTVLDAGLTFYPRLEQVSNDA
mgnify:CR=1 FL=1